MCGHKWPIGFHDCSFVFWSDRALTTVSIFIFCAPRHIDLVVLTWVLLLSFLFFGVNKERTVSCHRDYIFFGVPSCVPHYFCQVDIGHTFFSWNLIDLPRKQLLFRLCHSQWQSFTLVPAWNAHPARALVMELNIQGDIYPSLHVNYMCLLVVSTS